MSTQAVANVHVREALDGVRQELLQGRGLATPIRDRIIFPRMLANFISIGEGSGTLEQSVIQMGAWYDREVEQRSKTLVSLLDPTLTVLLGGTVAFIAVSIIMPIYGIISQVGNAAGR